jgi:hypothetical protein
MFEVIILYIYKSAQSNYIKEASKVDANSRYNISIWTIFANFFFSSLSSLPGSVTSVWNLVLFLSGVYVCQCVLTC